MAVVVFRSDEYTTMDWIVILSYVSISHEKMWHLTIKSCIKIIIWPIRSWKYVYYEYVITISRRLTYLANTFGTWCYAFLIIRMNPGFSIMANIAIVLNTNWEGFCWSFIFIFWLLDLIVCCSFVSGWNHNLILLIFFTFCDDCTKIICWRDRYF